MRTETRGFLVLWLDLNPTEKLLGVQLAQPASRGKRHDMVSRHAADWFAGWLTDWLGWLTELASNT